MSNANRVSTPLSGASLTGKGSITPTVPLTSQIKDEPLICRNANDALLTANSAREREKGPTTLEAVKKIASDALRIGEFVAGIVNAEDKFFDVQNTSNVTNGGDTYWLTGITTGTGANQRTGQTVKLDSMSFRWIAYRNTTDTSAGQTVRIMLFIDNQPLQVLPIPAFVLTDVSAPYGPISYLNMDSRGRYHVIYDKTILLSLTGDSIKAGEHNEKMTHHLVWDVAGDLQADALGGHIYALVICDDAANTPLVTFSSRIRFYDN